MIDRKKLKKGMDVWLDITSRNRYRTKYKTVHQRDRNSKKVIIATIIEVSAGGQLKLKGRDGHIFVLPWNKVISISE